MCVTCGCSDGAQTTLTRVSSTESSAVSTEGSHSHALDDRHTHSHYQADGTVITHSHTPASHSSHTHHQTGSTAIAHSHVRVPRDRQMGNILTLEQNLLSKNSQIARENRKGLQEKNIKALNLVSSPGSGKTTLLVRTIQDLQARIFISVIEGDQETLHDAERIAATGCPAIQVNTGTGCHLEADMIQRGLETLDPPENSLLLIENVGNLVCPALFDLGEQAKVAILSVTEGEDKPLKYPHMFRASQVMVLTKVDLLPYVPFNVERCLDYARTVNPNLIIFQVSAVAGQGLEDWYRWLMEGCEK